MRSPYNKSPYLPGATYETFGQREKALTSAFIQDISTRHSTLPPTKFDISDWENKPPSELRLLGLRKLYGGWFGPILMMMSPIHYKAEDVSKEDMDEGDHVQHETIDLKTLVATLIFDQHNSPRA